MLRHFLQSTLLASSLTLLFAAAASAEPKTWDNDPKGIKVFILAGQSNMVGYGKLEMGGNPKWVKGSKEHPKEIKGGIRCLREMAVNNQNYPEFDYTRFLQDPTNPQSSKWKSRPDVKFWWRNGGSGKLGGPIIKSDLGPLANNNQWFGPELGFGMVLGDHYQNDDVLIIKTAWGGHSLQTNFRSPTMVEKRGGEVGDSYKAIFDYSHELLSDIGAHFPEWKGRGYQIVGFAWHQGFNDKVSKTDAPLYKDNLPDFITDVRMEFGNPKLPFVIATTGMGHRSQPVIEKPPYESYHAVERAQLWAAGVEKPEQVLSLDTRPFWHPVEESPSTVGHHWHHNAQSYFLIGKSLGESMIKLLKP